MRTDPADDYYDLLGIDARADAAQLRRAWRRLALRWHPDRAGDEATATFQKILAAYRVLADPLARADYDARRVRHAGESVARAADSAAHPAGPRRPAPGVLLQRLSGSLNGLLACGAARVAEPGIIELYPRAAEIATGGMICITMRVPITCPACRGLAIEACARCASTGTIEELFSAWLAVPPGAPDGEILVPSALLPGMAGTILFRIRRRHVAAGS
jgi:DnaJ-class molecular chaperone